MICIKPFLKGALPLPCGQCMPCRINKRRVWTTRLTLELYQHREAAFVTLTYAPEHLPADGSVSKRELQLFMKRLRFAVAPAELRFFGVGEYGERTGRAHYHVLLYGIGADSSSVIQAAWPFGHIHVGSVTKESCGYCAGYVTKKLTIKGDPRLQGREPEFCLMSRKPGIGAKAAEQIGEQMVRTSGAAQWINREGDVPKVARMENGMWPLGRYMVGKVRLACGFENENSPPARHAQYVAEMQALREAVGDAAFRAAAPFVDWKKADAVLNRYAAKAKLSKKVF